MKKVTFNEEGNRRHVLVTWKYAYKASRERYWENVANDRMRFQRRIAEVGVILNPILDNMYRQIMLNESM